MIARSCTDSQSEILDNIERLHVPGGYEADITYGNGQFWKGRTAPKLKFDIDPQLPGVVKADSRALPVLDGSLKSIVFDPPFLTYVRAARDGNGSMVMAKRFSGYWRYDELEDHYESTIKEAARALEVGGVLVVKCQDIIHNHQMHPTHLFVCLWADKHGFQLKDLFVLVAKHRMPSPNRAGKQKHARIFHSYFIVLKKLKGA